MLRIHLPDRPDLYRPGDIIAGNVVLHAGSTTSPSQIKIAFYGRCEVQAHGRAGYSRDQRELVRSEQVIYTHDNMRGDPPLPPGEHFFPFRFPLAVPAILPPSFHHLEGGKDIGRIAYELEAQMSGTVSRIVKQSVLYFPSRLTDLPDGPSPTKYINEILIPCAATKQPSLNKGRLGGVLQKLKDRRQETPKKKLVLDIYLPRYAIFNRPLPVHVTMEDVDDPLLSSLNLQVVEVHYLLTSQVRVGSDPYAQSLERPVQRYSKTGITGIFLDGRCDLHTCAPYIPTPNYTFGHHEPTSIAPSFETDILSMNYHVNVGVVVTCGGKRYPLTARNKELYLLPAKAHPNIRRTLPEADAGATKLPAEADSVPAYEMLDPYLQREELSGNSTKFELAQTHRGFEMEGMKRHPVEIGGGEHFAELEGRPSFVAELEADSRWKG